MVDSRQKGARAESAVKAVLKSATGLNWQRVPGSGALGVEHKLKGDLYIPDANNKYCVEVKHYKDDHLTSAILSGKNPQLFEWWEQAIRQGIQVDKEPILIFKKDRGKWFVAQRKEPKDTNTWILIKEKDMYVSLLDDWLEKEDTVWV